MFLFAHHVAVELFGREFSPQSPLEHICVFGSLGAVLALAVYGGWTLSAKLAGRVRARSRAGA